tara:strand:+ start:743 stop:970 length:228 start_codon:yes stop_codon:yes gene_type:complete
MLMNEVEKSTTTLKVSYQEKINEIREHTQQIERLETELSTIRKQIVDSCSHHWEYEAPAIYERGYYYCSICGKTK